MKMASVAGAAPPRGGHADGRGTVDGLPDDLLGLFTATPVGPLDRLARLEILVSLKEVLDLQPVEGADVLEVLDVGYPGVVCGHHQDLVVPSSLVGHVEQADRARADQASGERRLLKQDESVQRVAILSQGVLDVAVVGRVTRGGEQQPVEADTARRMVHLVLVAVSLGNLDRDVVLHGGALRSRLADLRSSVSLILRQSPVFGPTGELTG